MQKKLINLGLVRTNEEIEYHNSLENKLFVEKVKELQPKRIVEEFIGDYYLLLPCKEKEAFEFIRKLDQDNYYKILLADSYLYYLRGTEIVNNAL